MKIAVYPGTFDPITNGHLDVIERALKIFDKLAIAVSSNPGKDLLFSTEERIDMIKAATKGMNVDVFAFGSLLVDFMKRKKLKFVIRGLRAVSDFDREFQMAVANKDIENSVETIFIMTDKKYFYLNSTMVKEMARYGGPLSGLVPKNVEEALRKKFSK
jgi:pantetheine-phosphate adenylyltransferase